MKDSGFQLSAIPTAQQLVWADQEVGVIIHYLMEIYNREYYDSVPNATKTAAVREKMPASIFAPRGWDVDQWIRAAKAAGAGYAVLVANHCTGFSLWPTKVNDYSVASCPGKDGKGDIVGEFAAACKKYGIKPGLYYSVVCNGYYDINDSTPTDYRSEKYQAYFRNVEKQVTELWSEYGDLFEIWFDGGTIRPEDGGPDLVPILNKYQPNAICFQGPDSHPHNIRWVGNEDGLAPWDCFSATDTDALHPVSALGGEEAKGIGNPYGKYWKPAETDMPNRDHEAYAGGWGWQRGETGHVYSPEHLLKCYCNSVGRNSNLLLGMAIGEDGRFEDEEQFAAFGKLIEKTFGEAALIRKVRGTCEKKQTILLERPEKLNYLVIREDITVGHRVTGFRVIADGREISSGRCIGHKRIVPLEGLLAEAVTVEITETAGEPLLRDMALY